MKEHFLSNVTEKINDSVRKTKNPTQIKVIQNTQKDVVIDRDVIDKELVEEKDNEEEDDHVIIIIPINENLLS